MNLEIKLNIIWKIINYSLINFRKAWLKIIQKKKKKMLYQKKL